MKVKELQKYLNSFEPHAKVLIGTDEELNNIHEQFEVAVLEDDNNLEVVIYPYGDRREDGF